MCHPSHKNFTVPIQSKHTRSATITTYMLNNISRQNYYIIQFLYLCVCQQQTACKRQTQIYIHWRKTNWNKIKLKQIIQTTFWREVSSKETPFLLKMPRNLYIPFAVMMLTAEEQCLNTLLTLMPKVECLRKQFCYIQMCAVI